MAKAGAEQINAAMDAMAAEGLPITVRALREKLGGGTCLGTISKLLQRRKAGAQRQIAAAAELSPVLRQAILDFVGQELSASQTAHEAEMNDNQQELMDLASENERVAGVLRGLTHRFGNGLHALSLLGGDGHDALVAEDAQSHVSAAIRTAAIRLPVHYAHAPSTRLTYQAMLVGPSTRPAAPQRVVVRVIESKHQ